MANTIKFDLTVRNPKTRAGIQVNYKEFVVSDESVAKLLKQAKKILGGFKSETSKSDENMELNAKLDVNGITVTAAGACPLKKAKKIERKLLEAIGKRLG